MMISLVFDTETTGLPLPSIAPLEKQPKIIELAIQRFEDGKLISKLEWLINPGEPLTEEIVKITGITDADLEGKPSFKDLLEEIKTAFAGADFLYAHNAWFDTSLMNFELSRIECTDFPWPTETVCTVAAFQHLFGRRAKLIELYHKILDKELFQKHRAQSDVDALVEILLHEGLL
jgi:DNA polymerase-3 subunit epsilon